MASEAKPDESHMDRRLTVEQGMEMFGIQFEMGCDTTVCVDLFNRNCACMDELCKQHPELEAKRAPSQGAGQ